MPLAAADIFFKLSEWPHRGTGSEEEMMARECLITELLGEPGVDVKEEGIRVPATDIPFLWAIAASQVFVIFFAGWFPYVGLLCGLIVLWLYLTFMDGRELPLIWLGPKKVSANLVASKGNGRALFILMAHLDSAPAQFFRRPDQVKHLAASLYVGSFVIGFGALVPIFDIVGLSAPTWLRWFIGMLILCQPLVASIDFWRYGYSPGANDNLSGVSAAAVAASRLWRHMPGDAEVRLVVTTAETAGMLGAQHYCKAHEDEFLARPTYVINLDTVGNKNLTYVTKCQAFTAGRYSGALVDTAAMLSAESRNFRYVSAGEHHLGEFGSVWFNRFGIDTITLTSYDDNNSMPRICTPEDTDGGVDIDQVARAGMFAEALVRMVQRK